MRKEVLAPVTIYALCESDARVRYVGKTVGTIERRLVDHIQAAKRSRLPVGRWIRKRALIGFRPIIKALEVTGPENWVERERFWIAFYRAVEPDMLNLTDGGDGLAGHVFSNEHREKISAALRTGESFKCEICATPFWRKRKDIVKGNCRFCSRECYGIWQRGRPRPVSRQFHAAGILAAAQEKKARTHCKRGHPLSGHNLFITPAGSRGCKECRKLHKAKYRMKQNA